MTRTALITRLSVVLAAAIACCLVVGLFVPAPVVAGDNATIFYFEPRSIDADAGETVTLDLVVSSEGDHVGDGIDELSFTIEYDSDVFTVTDVEHGSMLAAGNPDAEVDGSAEIDDESGTVTVEQERTPAGDGAKATEPAATLTLEVAEDASPTTETLEITDATAMLVSDYPQASIEDDATIHVEGGGETDETADDDGPDGVTLADDGEPADDGTTENGDEVDDDGESDDGDDSVPGFTLPPALVVIVTLLVLTVYSREIRP